MFVQPAGIEAAIRTHQHREVAGDASLHGGEQPEPMRAPGAFLLRAHDLPGHRDGTAAIDDRERQHRKALLQGGGVQRQDQPRLIRRPAAQYPAQERRKAGADVQVAPLGSAFIGSGIAPFPQSLDQAGLRRAGLRGQGSRHQRDAARAGYDHAIAP